MLYIANFYRSLCHLKMWLLVWSLGVLYHTFNVITKLVYCRLATMPPSPIVIDNCGSCCIATIVVFLIYLLLIVIFLLLIVTYDEWSSYDVWSSCIWSCDDRYNVQTLKL